MNIIENEAEVRLPVSEKYLLSIREAAAYFGIGIKKMRRLAEDNLGRFAVYSGNCYLIQTTKTNAGTRKLPITEDVAYCFRAILEDRPTPKVEQFVDGYSGFLYLDKVGLPEVALHWEHRFRHAVNRYNEIYRVQMPKITPHICRHTYCSNMAKAGMNPKTLQYLMGHSDIGVTMNTYTHLGLEDAKEEMIRMEELNAARVELNKTTGEKPVTQKMFRAI